MEGYSAIWICYYADNNIIDRCIVSDNSPEGEEYGSDYGIKIVNNADNNIITRCTIIKHRGRGITTWNNCYNNLIYNNNFILNTKNGYNSKECDNLWDKDGKGNYWDDYSIRYPDANQIGDVWDTPYCVGNNDCDNYPLVSFVEFDYPVIPDIFPVANFRYEPSTPVIGETIRFDASSSFDFQDIIKYDWDFGDNNTGTGRILNHSYQNEGRYHVSLSVTNKDGNNNNFSLDIDIDCCGCTVLNIDTNETFYKIQSAIDDIDTKSGHTIFVPSNQICYGNLIIDKPINLIGEDRNSTIIDANKKKSVVDIKVSNVVLSGFTIQNSGNDWWAHAGVRLGYWQSPTPKNCKIIGNNIINNCEGIYLYYSEGNILSNNFISDSRHYGINMHSGNRNTTISNNIIVNNSNRALHIFNSGSNKIFNNNITNKKGEGIYFEGSGNNKIYNNIFLGMHDGIVLMNSGNSDIHHNTFQSNTNGLNVLSSANTEITYNNFIDNNLDATFSYLLFEDLKKPGKMITWKGNYWDDAVGENYKIIRGVVSFLLYFLPLPWINFDWNPANGPNDFATTQGCGII
jgi:parallel beta-helix repeat protein